MSSPDLLAPAREALAADPGAAFALAEQLLGGAALSGEERIGALRVQAQARLLQGRHAESLACSERAVGLAQAEGNALLAAQVQIGQVDILGWLNRPEEALALGKQLTDRFKALNSPGDAARTLVNTGILYYRRDSYPEALSCYEEASALFATVSDGLSQARVQVNQANTLTAMHRIPEAIALYDAARATFQEHAQPIFVATVEINQGHLCYLSGEYSRALRLLESARAVFVEIDDQEGVEQCDLDSGDVYRALNLAPEALACYDQARAGFAQREAHYDQARAELGRAASLALQGRYPEASEALELARAAFSVLKNRLRLAHTDLLASELALSQGQLLVAYSLASRAARVFTRYGMVGLAAEARFGLALAELEAGTQNARGMQRIRRTAAQTGRGWLESRAEQALGRYYRRRGELKRGLQHLRRSVELRESARTQVVAEEHHTAFLRDKLGAYEDLVLALVERDQPGELEEALQVVEQAKSRLLRERLQSLLMPTTEEPAPGRLAQLRAELSAQYHRLLEEELQSETRKLSGSGISMPVLRELEQLYQDTLRQSKHATLTRHGGQPPSLTQLQQALADSETLVEFYIAKGTIGAFVITGAGIRFLNGLAPVEQVEHELRRLRFQLQRVATGGTYFQRYQQALLQETQQVLGGLYRLVWQPLEPYLETPRITVIPHGPLHGLPFHLLHDGTSYLLDRHCLTSALSATLWYLTRKNGMLPAAQGEVLLMGASPEVLPHASRELALLGSHFPGAEPLLGTKATLEAFRRRAPEAPIIHLATHGLFRSDNALFSSLQFSDGWLMASDLYRMRLSASLVTLSACRTGMGQVLPGDEVFGLLRGFFAAGARSVAASLWAVDDWATAELMSRFYSCLSEQGKAEGLRAAQRHLRESHPHPYFWGAFILMGNP